MTLAPWRPPRPARATRHPPRAAISIEGLADFRRDLRVADRQVTRAFNKALRTAGDPIVSDAKNFYEHGNPDSAWPHPWRVRTGRSLRGIRTEVHYGGVAVVLGGSRYRHLLGQEWGSFQWPQFGPPRGRWHADSDAEAGTFFWPAYMAGVENLIYDVEFAMQEAIDTLAGLNRGAARLARDLSAHRPGIGLD